jgi:predicted  nucleic acid-binding Zn-ribbon protein
MDIKKIITWAPILLAFIGSLYTGVNVVSKLNNTIEQHTITITSLGNQLDSMDTKYTIEVKNLTQKYTEGREELLKEMTQAYAMIAEVRVKAEALRDGSFKLASEAELRALEQSYYKLYDSINQLTYDLKDMKRQLTGGY